MKVLKSLVMVGAISGLMGVASSAHAVMAIDWSNSGGYVGNLDNDVAVTDITGGGIYGILILLAPGQMPQQALTTDLTGGGRQLAEMDLAATTPQPADKPYGTGAAIATIPEALPPAGSSVFARIFQASDAGSAAVADVWYYDGPVVPVENVDITITPRPPNQFYDANRGAAASFGGAYGVDALNTAQVVVPEPGTLALLGLGMLTVFFRRRR